MAPRPLEYDDKNQAGGYNMELPFPSTAAVEPILIAEISRLNKH